MTLESLELAAHEAHPGSPGVSLKVSFIASPRLCTLASSLREIGESIEAVVVIAPYRERAVEIAFCLIKLTTVERTPRELREGLWMLGIFSVCLLKVAGRLTASTSIKELQTSSEELFKIHRSELSRVPLTSAS